MDIMTTPRRTRKSQSLGLWMMMVLCAMLAAASFFIYFIWGFQWANKEYAALELPMDKAVFVGGAAAEWPAIGEGEGLKLALPFIQLSIDPAIHYEEESRSVIVTTADKVVQMKTDQLTAIVNDKPFDLRFPVELHEGTVYFPIGPLAEYYGIDIRESPDSGAVLVFKEGEIIQWGKVLPHDKHPERTKPMRTGASLKEPILEDLVPGQRLMIWEETQGWYRVQTESGYMGYLQKSDLALDAPELIPAQTRTKTHVPWSPLGGRINLTWEAVYNVKPNTAQIGPMPGLNVVSPTWFTLKDGQGNIAMKPGFDPSYIAWAHGRGYQIWALFDNAFDPKLTEEALSTHERRMHMIRQLLAYAEMFNLDGINLDFENVYLKERDKLTQFVRELTPLAHEQGLVVSIDVTIKSSSEMWSMFYDRKALAQVVDYMMVMTYDEHYQASPVAGSVASLPWVEQGIVRMMREDDIPPSKLLLGVPFYTRIWAEDIVDGKPRVLTNETRSVGMNVVNTIIRDRNLTPVYKEEVGQNYVEYVEGGKTYRIWIEDEVSMAARMELIRKYDLAGVASWRRGFETPNIWEVIRDHLDRRP